MRITWKDLTVDFSQINKEEILSEWKWLVGKNKSTIMVSSIGDAFLQDNDGKVFWLDVGRGTVSQVAESLEEFENKLHDDEQVNEWFMLGLVMQIRESGMELQEGKLFGYKQLPILGGDYQAENFELTDILVHFSTSGEIHKKIKDLPDKTYIKLNFSDKAKL